MSKPVNEHQIDTQQAQPSSPSGDSVVVIKRGMSFNARLAVGAVVIAALVVAVIAIVRERSATTSRIALDVGNSTSLANGDVSAGAPVDTSMMMTGMGVATVPVPDTLGPRPVITPSTAQTAPPPDPDVAAMIAPPAPTSASPSTGFGSSTVQPPRHPMVSSVLPGDSAAMAAADTSTVVGMVIPPSPRRALPGTSSVVAPQVSAAAVAAAAPPITDVCASPNDMDQRECLSDALGKADAELDRVYKSVIAAMRQQANLTPNDPDPDAVRQLRDAQRQWLDDREAACRDAGTPPLYAKERAACYAQMAAARVKALRSMADTSSGG